MAGDDTVIVTPQISFWLTAKHAGEAATLLHLQLDGVKMLCSCQNSSCLDPAVCSSWRGREAGSPRRSVYLQTAHRRLSKPHQALQTTHRPHTAGRGTAGTLLKGFASLLLMWNVTCKHVFLCKSMFNTGGRALTPRNNVYIISM